VTGAAEQLLYRQLPALTTELFGGLRGNSVWMDFVVPPGGKWRLTRVVLAGVVYSDQFQVNLLKDDGSSPPHDVVVSSIGLPLIIGPSPCCGGEVFENNRTLFDIELEPGTYWIEARLGQSAREFEAQRAAVVGQPAMVRIGYFGTEWVPIPSSGSHNDVAFSVYGTKETAEEVAANLQTTIEGFGLASGTANSLLVKLAAASAALAAGDNAGACRSLQDLINATIAQAGKKLTQAQSDTIVAEATRMRAIIGC
jgi:hypothetical protein